MHLDGVRLWEAVASWAGSIKKYCAWFDSVSLCLSKGLGAPIGSIIVGSSSFARWIRQSIGGGMRQAGVVAAAGKVAVEDVFLGKRLELSHKRAQEVSQIWTGLGGVLRYPVETNMVWFDLEAAGISAERFIEEGQKVGLRLLGGRLVVHYQIGDEAVGRLEELMKVVLKGRKSRGTAEHEPEKMAIKVE